MEKDSLEGYVYIATNPAYKETVKIGLTHGQKHPSTRVKELSKSTEVLDVFKCEWYIKVSDCKLAEALLHNHFNNRRIKHNKEFFQITLEKAVLESEETLHNFFKSLDTDRFCSIPVQFLPSTAVENELIENKNAALQNINYPSLLTNVQYVDITERVKEYWYTSEIISLQILQVDYVGIWLEITVKQGMFFDEFSQRININNFKSTQLDLFNSFDLNESIKKNSEVLIYNLRDIFSSYCLINGKLLSTLIENFEDKNAENTIKDEEDIEELELQDFANFNEEVRDGCLRILEIINANLKKYKISGKTKKKNLSELTNALINSDFPNCEYLLEINYEVRNEKESESKHWSIELGCHAFIVESYVRTYQIEIGGDRFTSFYYSQNYNESCDIEGYFSTWFDELEQLLESQYAEQLSIEISSDEFE